MNKSKIPICLLFLCIIGTAYSQDFSRFDIALDSLDSYASTFPPNIKDKNDSIKAYSLFHRLEKDMLTAYPKDSNNIDLKYRFGILYQYGHNLNIPNAWEKYEASFACVLATDSANAHAHCGLGHLYVTTGVQYAKKAEHELLLALRNIEENSKSAVYADLAFAKYYQADYAAAHDYCLKYVKYDNSVDARKLLEIIDEKLTKSNHKLGK